jgi:hypothetical protein
MDITPNEIASIEDAGTLNGHPVQLIRLKGGFWVATGKPRGKYRTEAIAAGSHPAIVKFNIEKTYPDYQPALMKSENFVEGIVEKHSHFLSEDLRKSGHDIYSVQEGPSIDFHITKQNIKLASVSGVVENNFVVISDLNIPKEFSRGLAGAAVEKAASCNLGLRFKR